MASETRQRIMEAAAASLALRGYRGTGLKQVSVDSGAPIGSLYHFFPGGKDEIAVSGLTWSAARYAKRVGTVLGEREDPAEAVRFAFQRAAETLEATEYADACPIATVALEVASTNEPLRRVTGEIFEDWLRGLDAWFAGAGLPAVECRRLSTMFLAALEGGFLLCRAARDPTALELLGEQVASAVESTLLRALRARPLPGKCVARDDRADIST
jgi:AcrR family transcriptional regulator